MGFSQIIIWVVVGYFALLIGIARLTARGSDNESFFIGNRSSPWYVVAFGMVGATLSGITFISVPGFVYAQQFSYMQTVFGYVLGYATIAFVLMPMYYRLRLTSIYTYLERRFGDYSYKTGAAYFLLSRIIGASFRLYLVAIVLDTFVMKPLGIPFIATVAITILLIWLYTFQSGIKTIVWTDTLQTASMLIAVGVTFYVIAQQMDLSFGQLVASVRTDDMSKTLFFADGWGDTQNFFKMFLAGMFVTIVMTGLDQDMMQKNLSCRNLKDAQKNMMSLSVVIVLANVVFLSLGVLLFQYADFANIELPIKGANMGIDTDLVFPTIALEHLPAVAAVLFVLGLIAAAYSSADSALTALTTSVCIDFLNFEKSNKNEKTKRRIRLIVHLCMSVALLFVILLFQMINNRAVIGSLFTAAGYTYGPLLGLYAFGFFVRRQLRDRWVPVICILCPILTYIINLYSEQLLFGYKFDFELLLLNGLLTFIGLWIISDKAEVDPLLMQISKKQA